MDRARIASGLIQGPRHGLDLENNLGEGLNLGIGQDRDRAGA